MFTDDETRAIRQLYLWPKLGTYFLLSIFPALAVWVACIFVDNAILNAEGAYGPGLNLLLSIVMVYVVLCLVFSIGTRVIAGCEVSASFSTDPEDEFDEDSEPYIYLTIELSD